MIRNGAVLFDTDQIKPSCGICTQRQSLQDRKVKQVKVVWTHKTVRTMSVAELDTTIWIRVTTPNYGHEKAVATELQDLFFRRIKP